MGDLFVIFMLSSIGFFNSALALEIRPLTKLFFGFLMVIQADTGAYLMMLFLSIFVVLCPLYVVGSLGLAKIARKHGVKGSGFAWAGILNNYVLGTIGLNKNYGWLMLVLSVPGFIWAFGRIYLPYVDLFVRGIPDVLMIGLFLAFYVLKMIALHRVYLKMSAKARLLTIATVLSAGILGPVFLFAIRNNDVISTSEQGSVKESEA